MRRIWEAKSGKRSVCGIQKGRQLGARKAASRSVLGDFCARGAERAARAAQIPKDPTVLARGRGFLLKASGHLGCDVRR